MWRRSTAERPGSAVLRFVGGQPVQAENVAVPGAGCAGSRPEIRRVDPFDPSISAAAGPLAGQVRAPDARGGAWVWGRILPEAGGAAFVEQRRVGTRRRGDRWPGGDGGARRAAEDARFET